MAGGQELSAMVGAVRRYQPVADMANLIIIRCRRPIRGMSEHPE